MLHSHLLHSTDPCSSFVVEDPIEYGQQNMVTRDNRRVGYIGNLAARVNAAWTGPLKGRSSPSLALECTLHHPSLET